jgi:cystathionine gamma-synthase
MTHAAMDQEAQEAAGIKPNLIRLSVGIEDKSDLIADLFQALSIAQSKFNDGTDHNKVTSISELERSAVENEPTATCRLSPALAALW